MKKREKLIGQLKTQIALGLIMTVLFVSGGGIVRAQTNSVPNSAVSATNADDALRRACAEAVEELKAARSLLAAQGIEIQKQKDLLELEQEISAQLKNIGELSEREKGELRKALVAKEKQIAALDAANQVLKKQKFTVWKAFKVVVVSAAAGIIIGKVF